jgi:broad specificity phosphatase PhoE
MAIYLIRHGETDSNAARVVQTPDVPLSARGLAQAERLARRLAGDAPPLGAILASDLARAARTAERVAAATGAAVRIDPLLAERNFGALRGTPYAELSARGIDLFAPGYAPPGGESWDAFHARVDRAWERVQAAAARARGPLAVITHGLVCHSIVSRHLAFGDGVARPEPGRLLAFGNTAVTLVDGPPWTVRLLGCTAHLESDAAPRAGAAV